ncbi:MAG TPA: TonB-dependent receptor [Caulobacteraceae bacterium]|jgi:iron complex outermembrane receptor protein|nr:TonB-dependent receptor [Caulobacteraceae bacterium]
MKIHALCLSASAMTLALSGAAVAQTAQQTAANSQSQTTLTEVVVTAERRTQALQKTAIAASVLTGKSLIEKNVITVDQLQFVTPSLTVNNFGQGNNVDIRGIGKGEHNSQTGTGVVTYRDGVPTFPGYFQEEPYFDVASVEVLRGPQGTFSGQNATGGALIVNTNNPVIGGGYDGYIYGRFGNYTDGAAQGAVNIPINDTLAARIAFNTEYRKTFFHVSGPWTGDPNPRWGSLQLSLLWTPNSQLKVLFKTDYNYLNNGAYFGPLLGVTPKADFFNFSNNYHTSAIDQFMRSILRIDYTTQSGIDFRSVTGVQWGRTGWTGDIEDGAAATALFPIMIDEGVDETLWTQEFNVISPADKPVTWVLGAFYENNTYNFPFNRFDIGLPKGVFDDDLFGVNRTWTAAAFGQVSLNLPAGFQLQAGVRYSAWSTFNNATFYVPEFLPFLFAHQIATETGDNTTGKITLNWNVDDHNFLYAFVASGAKPGGLNVAVYSAATFSFPIPGPFGQEYVWDYEVGWKSSFLDNHVHTQLGGYYNDFKHFQVSLPIPNNPTQTTEYNVPNTTVLYGFEGSVQAAFGGFSFNADLGLEKSRIDTFFVVLPGSTGVPGLCNSATGPATATCVDLQGHPQTYAPEVTFNVGVQYRYLLRNGDTITPAISFAHISDQWGTVFDNAAAGDHLGPRNLLNASIAWQHGTWVVTAFGTNLMDDRYVAAIISPLEMVGNPRQYGVSIMKSF